jgi:carboxypeptidase PM20D1
VSDASIFDALHEYVAASYPKVWAQLGVERLSTDNLSLLVTWDGSEPGLKPILFISHIDVVPVTEDTLPHWAHPPFSGAIADGYVWGRGAIDVKIGFVGLLEAAEELIKEGFQPKRTLLFAFSHDEESLSGQGAGQCQHRNQRAAPCPTPCQAP